MLSLSTLTIAAIALGWVFYRALEAFTAYKVSTFEMFVYLVKTKLNFSRSIAALVLKMGAKKPLDSRIGGRSALID